MLEPDPPPVQPAPVPQTVPIVLGGAVALLGLVVICGWLLHIRAMVEFRAGLVAMTFNTALCFLLAGSAVLLPAVLSRPMVLLRNVSGAIMMVLCALILAEYGLDRDLGVDWVFLQKWLLDGNVHPGRMAPNTAIGFLLAGSCLILMTRVVSKRSERLFLILVFCVAGIGLTGLIGYAIAPELLFGWARSARMALHTGVGMVVMSVALWSSWYRLQRARGARFFGLDDRISFMSAAILAVSTLAAGMTGFVFHQSILETSLREKLQFRLDGQQRVIYTVLSQARTAAEHAGHDRELLEHVYAMTRDSANAAAVKADMDDLTREGFHGVTLYGADGRLLLQTGAPDTMRPTDKLILPERNDETAALAWDGQIVFDTSMPLMKDGVAFARLDLRQRLPILQAQLFDLRGLGQSGEIVICTGRTSTLLCLPSGRQQASYSIPRINRAGLPLPMSHAVNGEQGLIGTIDYKGNNVMAAFAPLSENIGLVVKQDTSELYGVVRTQIAYVAPALLVLLLVSGMLMHQQIRPLVARLIRSEREANDKQLEMNALVGSVGEGILTMNEQGLIESFNPAASGIFGYTAEEVLGQPVSLLMPKEMRHGHEQGMRNYLATGHAKVIGRPKLELPGVHKDGTRFTLELTVNEIRFETRRLFVGVVRDITERKRVEAKLIQLAQYDTLTGLPNRALFMDRLANATLRANRSKSALAVLFLDLDGFKKVNDTLGHHSGDELLRKFGERLTQSVRKSDTVARLAGDEFTIILEELHEGENDARAVADKIIAAMHHPFDLPDGSVSVTTSIGMALHTGALTDVDDLLRRADDAMYRAKFSGKNRWSV